VNNSIEPNGVLQNFTNLDHLSEAADLSSVTPAGAYLLSLQSEVSRVGMKSSLNTLARVINPGLATSDAWRSIPWAKLTAPAVRTIFAELKGSPASRNKALSAMKGVAKMAWEMHQLSTDELERIKSIKGDKGTREISGRCIPSGEIWSLLQACVGDASHAGLRDTAMISLAAVCGARRAEIASLDISQISEVEDGLRMVKVIGKGNKERKLFVSGNALLSLEDWLAARGSEAGAIFCAIRKGGKILHSRFVSPTALDKVLAKRSRQAGIMKVKWHDFRRTTASNFLDAGIDLATVSKILGHANVSTTARYDRRGERALKKASEAISVPYLR